MFKKVNVEILYEGNILYKSEGKTIFGIMLHIAAMLITYNKIDITITYNKTK